MAVFILSLFYVAAFICFIMGLYLLLINMESLLNKLAFLFCISLSCWCFGSGNTIAAANISEAMVWKRFAAIGVGMFYGFFMHYIILLTEHEQLMKRVWGKIGIYLPSIYIVYVFALSEKTTAYIYHLTKMDIGWVNVSSLNIFLILFDIYICVYLLFSAYLVLSWKKRTKDATKRKMADFVIITYMFAFFSSVLVQILDALWFHSYLHVLGPLTLLLPMLAAGYGIEKFNFMQSLEVSEENIFMEQFRTKIIRYLSVMFFIGAFIFLFLDARDGSIGSFFESIIFACLLCVFGICIHVIQKKIKWKELKLISYALILSLAIPVITLKFVSTASITVWAFPFVLVIAALLFYSRTVLIMTSVSMILTQMYLYIRMPNAMVTVDARDYIGRIGLMGMAIFLIYYINQIYIRRLKQLSDKIKVQDLLFQVSAQIINTTNQNLEEKMEDVLELLCQYLNADRAHIYYRIRKSETEQADYVCWCTQESRLNVDILRDISISEFPWWKRQLREHGLVQIKSTETLSYEAKEEQNFLTKQHVKSMIAVPLISNNQRVGFLRIDFVMQERTFDEEMIKTLMTVGNMLGEAENKTSYETEMEQMAFYDQLTNIPNRMLFGEHIKQAIQSAGRRKDSFCILFLDLDSFKMVNDTLGHQIGDQVLVAVAEKLGKCLRRSDILCRFGGDEFLIMLNHITAKRDIEVVLKKMIQVFEQPILIEEKTFNVTASIGIAVYPIDGSDKDTLIKNADIAMYQAKNNGKNQYMFCSEEMKEEIALTMILTNHLYRALEREELSVVYQPQVDAKSGKVVAAEALLRWNNDELGSVSPDTFIPIAEKTGLIIPIGEWVLRETCRQNKIWQQLGLPPIRVAVNVSVNQLCSVDFIDQVRKILSETGLDPGYLELEITENIAMQESEFIVRVLSGLKEIGVFLAIDDFGIEYSSLSRIKMLPIDRLKLDMHFIKGIVTNEKDRIIVDVIIRLAQKLNLKVIAEGVEELEQLTYLKKKMCDEIQGYYFYKPLSQKDMQEVLTELRMSEK